MKKAFVWLAVVLVLVLAAVVVAAFFIDEPLRRRTEEKINAALEGYTVRIGRLDFHPIGFSIELFDCVIVQNAHPDPPIAEIPRLAAGVDWKALLSRRIVASFEVNDPKFFINLKQTRTELQDEVPVEERGWQSAVQSIYPLEINELTITNGALTYIDEEAYRPLELRNVNLTAYNIRNVRSGEGEYPSDVYVEGAVFKAGKIVLQGKADFLAEPHVAFKADLNAQQIELDYFRPIAQRYNVSLRRGVLNTHGTIEYAKNKKILTVPKLDIQKLVADYVHTKPATSPTKELSKKADRVIREHSNEPTLKVQVGDINITGSELGIVSKASEPEYRLFVSGAQVQARNLSNQSEEGTATITASGKFMNSGQTRLQMRFMPKGKTPNFDLQLSVEEAELKALNPLLKAYAGIDVVAGKFSFFAEISVRDGFMDGYVKPLFKDIDVYDPGQDRKKGIFTKLYEGILGGLAWVLENRPRDEVATTTRISGKLSDPETSLTDIISGLVQNAFFRAILPGLEQEIQAGRRRK